MRVQTNTSRCADSSQQEKPLRFIARFVVRKVKRECVLGVRLCVAPLQMDRFEGNDLLPRPGSRRRRDTAAHSPRIARVGRKQELQYQRFRRKRQQSHHRAVDGCYLWGLTDLPKLRNAQVALRCLYRAATVA
jgi:hypothetical protein